MDTNESNGPEESVRRSRRNSGIVAAGVAFGLTLAGLGVAAAQTDSATDTSTTTAAQSTEDNSGSTASPSTEEGTTTPAAPDARTQARPPRADKPQETELTGDVAEKVKAAALAAVPDGTIIRVETDADGSPYEAHVRKADGTEVVVKVNESFEVTATEEGHMGRHGPGRRGPGGPGGFGPGETALTGETAEKVTGGAQAAVADGTVIRVGTDSEGTYQAHVHKADGTQVDVKIDASFNVTSVDEREMRGPRPPAPESETD